MDAILKETGYCEVLAQAWSGDRDNDGICLERIRTKERNVEEIRMAWWKSGRQTPRPADIDAVDWPALFAAAVREGVFSDEEKYHMVRALLT